MSALLLHWGSYGWDRNLWGLIFFFFLPVTLPSVVPRLATDSAVRLFPGVWKLLFLRLHSQDGAPFLPLLSLSLFFFFFVFYIFSCILSKTMGCFSVCLMSSARIQKLFCGIYSAFKCSFDEFVGEKVVSLSYSSTFRTAPCILISCIVLYEKNQFLHIFSSFINFLFSISLFYAFIFCLLLPLRLMLSILYIFLFLIWKFINLFYYLLNKYIEFSF